MVQAEWGVQCGTDEVEGDAAVYEHCNWTGDGVAAAGMATESPTFTVFLVVEGERDMSGKAQVRQGGHKWVKLGATE